MAVRNSSFAFCAKFKEDPMAVTGVIFLLLLLIPALLAPLLGSAMPFFFYDRAAGNLSFPWFRAFFAPPGPEKLTGIFFNYLLLFLPLLRLFARCLSPRGFRVASMVAAIALLLPFALVQPKMDRTGYRAEIVSGRAAGWMAPIPYDEAEIAGTPYETPFREHLLGCDDIGRDVAVRMLSGARVSLFVGIAATGLSLLLGTAVGLTAGYFRGRFDLFVMRVAEVMMCFPAFLLLLILTSLLRDYRFEQSVVVVVLVIAFTGWIGLAQLVRGEVLQQRALPYIAACESAGLPAWRIMLFHLLPNVAGPILITFSFGVAGAILAESSLSFLGFGVQPPTASWGGLLRQAFEDPLQYWHLTFFPGLALFLAVCGFNFAGEGLRRALNPKE